MFYGKSENYSFKTDFDYGFDLYVEGLYSEPHLGCFNSIDLCILYAAYELLVVVSGKSIIPLWKKIYILNKDNDYEMEIYSQDKLVEAVWETLVDVNIDENDCLEQNWFIFPVGTFREDIWYWFDEHHSKGIGWLINEYEG